MDLLEKKCAELKNPDNVALTKVSQNKFVMFFKAIKRLILGEGVKQKNM